MAYKSIKISLRLIRPFAIRYKQFKVNKKTNYNNILLWACIKVNPCPNNKTSVCVKTGFQKCNAVM